MEHTRGWIFIINAENNENAWEPLVLPRRKQKRNVYKHSAHWTIKFIKKNEEEIKQ